LTEKPEKRALVVRQPDGAVTLGGQGRRLISRMNEDMLIALASTRRDLAPVMRRLGDYELHEEDYQQLHIWARDFTEDGHSITALELADELAAEARERNLSWIELGRIRVVCFAFFEIGQLDLSNLPKLTKLWCSAS